MYRVILITILLATLILPALAAEQVTVNFWHAMDGTRGQVLNRLIEDFNSTHPDIKVIGKFVGVSEHTKDKYNNSYNVLFQELLINISTATPPDIAQVYENWTSQFITINAIVPVEDFMKSSNGLSAKETSDLIPAFLEANKYDHKLWTLPFNKSIYVLYYNKKIFDENGIKPPKTWQEMGEISKKLIKKDKNDVIKQWGLSFKPDVDTFSVILLSSGENLLNDKGKAIFNSEGGKKTLDYLKGLTKSGAAQISFSPQQDFMEGRCAMFLDTTSRISSLDGKMKFEFAVAPCPSDNKNTKILLAGTNLAIFSNNSPEKQAASWEFIKWITSTANTTKWAMETGYLPIRQSAIKSQEYQTFVQKNSIYKVGLSELENAVVPPKVAAWQSIRGIIDDTVFNTLNNQEDIRQALDNAVSLVNQFLK